MCVRLRHLQGNLPQRVCEAAKPSARFCGKFCPQGQTQRPRPADETGSCVWRSAPVFASTRCGAPQKSAKRKRAAVCLLQGRHDARRKSREPQPKEFLPRDCAQKWVPPKACRFSTRSAQEIPAPSFSDEIRFLAGALEYHAGIFPIKPAKPPKSGLPRRFLLTSSYLHGIL